MKILSSDIGITIDILIKVFDNKVAINHSDNRIMHDMTKHIEIDYHIIHEKIDPKEFVLSYIKTQFHVVEVLTKGLSKGVFDRHVGKLSIFNMYAYIEVIC